MLIKMKLPDRKEPDYPVDENNPYLKLKRDVYNECLDDVQSMNPPLEMDVEAMAKELLIFECDMTWDSLEESTKTFYRTQAIYLIANYHKWIKEQGK